MSIAIFILLSIIVIMLLNKKHTTFGRVLKYLVIGLAIGLAVHQGVTEIFQYKMPLYYLLITFSAILVGTAGYYIYQKRKPQFIRAKK